MLCVQDFLGHSYFFQFREPCYCVITMKQSPCMLSKNWIGNGRWKSWPCVIWNHLPLLTTFLCPWFMSMMILIFCLPERKLTYSQTSTDRGQIMHVIPICFVSPPLTSHVILKATVYWFFFFSSLYFCYWFCKMKVKHFILKLVEVHPPPPIFHCYNLLNYN